MMNVWHIYGCLIRNNLIKQMRSYSFLIVVLLTLFLGYACVPSPASGYQVFYIGGVRGVYNSAWLGGMVTMLSTLLLWLFAFFMLRSQVSEDERRKVGQVIASTPVSNFRYIASKAISNYVVLLVIELILFLAFMAMQLIRGEDYQLQILDYAQPFLFIVMPSLLVLAALTVFFDVFPGLKGVVGNIIFFGLWVFFSVISIAVPNSFLDVFGLDMIRTDMVQEASLQYDFLNNSQEGGSFGYYPVEGASPTFEWHGVDWEPGMLVQRLIWTGIALVIILLSALVFNRFKTPQSRRTSVIPLSYESRKKAPAQPGWKEDFSLSPVQKEKGIRLMRLIRAELVVMLKGSSIWWYLLVLGSIVSSLLIPLDKMQSWLPLLMLWPIAIWSQMGTREKYYFTRDMILSSCPPLKRFFAVWVSGIVVAVLISSGVLIHFAMDGKWEAVMTWMAGAIFAPTLAMTLGTLSGTRKMFEVVYILWWYMGPVNSLPYLDFLGISANHSTVYLIVTCILFVAALAGQQIATGAAAFGSFQKSRSKQHYKGGVS